MTSDADRGIDSAVGAPAVGAPNPGAEPQLSEGPAAFSSEAETGVSPRIPPHSWLPAVGITVAGVAAGVLLIIVSYAKAKTSTSSQHFDVFWIGISLVLVSTLYLGTRRWLTPSGVKVLLIAFGIATYVPKFLMSMTGPVYFDEFAHFRHANDLLANGNLFNKDPYLAIVRYFPGLSAVTVAVHEVTRLSIWHSGQLVVLVAHCSVPITVFLIGRSAGLSQRASFVAALFYLFNPSYMYFDTQYAYESLALPLAFLVILTSIRIISAETRKSITRWTVTGCAAAVLCIVTHHLSSLFMGLMCFALIAGLRKAQGDARVGSFSRRAAWTVTGVAVIGSIGWIGLVAPETLSYIWPHVSSGFEGLIHIFVPAAQQAGGGPFGQSGTRALFSGSGAPFYEKVAAYVSPVIALVAFVGSARHYWTRDPHPSPHHHYRIRVTADSLPATPIQQRTILVSLVLSALYFASLPFALTSGGSEGAHRSWGFTYLGVSIVFGYFVDRVMLGNATRLRLRRAASVILAVSLIVVCIGNVAAGENVLYRFPGPYVFGTDTRSTTPELRSLAQWMNRNLIPGSFVITDRFTGEQVEAYTDLNVAWTYENEQNAIYREGDHPDIYLRDAIRSGNFRYFVLDKRIENGVPTSSPFGGYYGPESINSTALSQMRSTPFNRLIHQTPNYEVFELHP